MFIVEIHEYDCLTGNTYKQEEYHDRDTAEAVYETQRIYDFDYGNHYRKTRLFERGET